MNWQKPLSRAGFFAALAAGGFFAADAASQGGAIRRACSTVYSTVTQTVTVTTPPPPPPAPPPPVPLGGSLYTRLPSSTGSVVPLDTAAEIASFLATAADGEIGEIAAGTYNAPVGSSNGRFTLSGNSGGSSNPVTLRAAAGATVILRPTAASPHEVLTITGGTQYWRFENLIFENAGTGSNYQNLYVATCSDIELYGCTFRNAGAGTGTFVEEDCPRIHYINCASHDNNPVPAQNQSHGYYITGDDCMLLNCKAYNQQGMGFQVRTNDANGPANVIVANCVAYNCKPADSSEYAGFYIEGAADGCRFHNNISYDNRNGFRGVGSGAPSPHNIAAFNIANANDNTQYGRASTSVALDYDKDGDGVYTSAGDNLTSDPWLVDPANGDFHLSAGSSAIGYGLDAYCPTFDFDGNPRSQCDAGPYRWAPSTPHVLEWR